MNPKLATLFSVLVIVVFIVFIVVDTIRPERQEQPEEEKEVTVLPDSLTDKWQISDTIAINEGTLKAVGVSYDGFIYAGGENFVCSYDSSLNQQWKTVPPAAITSLTVFGDTLFASTGDLILVYGKDGKLKDEWGPFEDNSLITSVASNKSYVAFADAGNKIIIVLDKKGRVRNIIGQDSGQFIIPSPYFDVALDDGNSLYIANTGLRRIETRSVTGQIMSTFGEPGLAPGAFCGCCNPSHFIVTDKRFITAEKGINRIKILGQGGTFIEYVSSVNKFNPSIPLDLASADGKVIYAANPADSRLYVFRRK